MGAEWNLCPLRGLFEDILALKVEDSFLQGNRPERCGWIIEYGILLSDIPPAVQKRGMYIEDKKDKKESKDKEFDNVEKILKDINVEKEENIKVCELFDQYVRKGRQEGRQEGMRFLILDNLEEGKTEDIIIKKLMRGFSLGQDEAKHYFDQCTMGTAADY